MSWFSRILGSAQKPNLGSDASQGERTIVQMHDGAPPMYMDPRAVTACFVTWPPSPKMPSIEPKALIDAGLTSSQRAFWTKVMQVNPKVKAHVLTMKAPDNSADVLAALSTVKSDGRSVVMIPMKVPSMSLKLLAGFCLKEDTERVVLPYDGGILPQ